MPQLDQFPALQLTRPCSTRLTECLNPSWYSISATDPIDVLPFWFGGIVNRADSETDVGGACIAALQPVGLSPVAVHGRWPSEFRPAERAWIRGVHCLADPPLRKAPWLDRRKIRLKLERASGTPTVLTAGVSEKG